MNRWIAERSFLGVLWRVLRFLCLCWVRECQPCARTQGRGRAQGLCIAAVILAPCLLMQSACTTMPQDLPLFDPDATFSAYRSAALSDVAMRRSFQTSDKPSELAWNTPGEWVPFNLLNGGRARKGILLVHGLGDSPWTFHDLSAKLQAEGFLVRTVLLPGHGTRPQDLLETTVDQWRRVVLEQASALQRDVDGPVYLGGFSTGANLVLEAAQAQPSVAGLVLFSPGFKPSASWGWAASLIATIRPWVIDPGHADKLQNAVRYMVTPMNALAQYHRSAIAAQRILQRQRYDKPVFMVVAQHDAVLDANYLLRAFQQRFTHPRSRLIWYGSLPEGTPPDDRVLVRADRIPGMRISQFSHMGIMFSPDNALYGVLGSERVCMNSLSRQAIRACEQQGEELWYSDWGYREEGKVHARLTFNPYFEWQAGVMSSVIGIDPAEAESGTSTMVRQRMDEPCLHVPAH